MRASQDFLLDVLASIDHQSDLLDRILLVVIAQANLQAIASDHTLQLRYATLEAPPPDELRRPVSISAVATIIGIPFETARRRVRRLVDAGACELSNGGVRLPERSWAQPVVTSFLSGTYELARRLYVHLKADGDLPELMPHARQPRYNGSPPVRIVARAALDHFLRMVEVLTVGHGGLAMALVLLAAQRENLRPGQAAGNHGACTVGHALPARASRIARFLKLPETTVRRRLKQAAARGWCKLGKQGAIVTSTFATRPEYRAAERATYTSLFRLLGSLQSFGVLPLWDEPASPSSASLNVDRTDGYYEHDIGAAGGPIPLQAT